MGLVMTIVGLLGAALCVAAYGLLSFEKIDSKGLWYFLLNGFGGLFLLLSIAYDYDSGDTGGIVVELCWVAISLFGIIKVLMRRKNV